MSPLDRLALFRATRHTVPAYRALLDARPTSSAPVQWDELPVIDKPSYVRKYSWPDLHPHGKLPALIHASSGSSGEPTYWFRGPKQRAAGVRAYSRILRDNFGIGSESTTLVVVCFSMGVWVAGGYTLLAFEQIAADFDGRLSVVTPGIDLDDVVAIFRNVAPRFDAVVLAGYPAFIDLVAARLRDAGCPMPSRFFVMTSGDKSTEAWRDRTMEALSIGRPEGIANVYGSSDCGILGFETPRTVALRRRCVDDVELRRELFGECDGSALPALFEYDASHLFIEAKDGEILVTADLDMPLLRYNIRDCGRVIDTSEAGASPLLRAVAGAGRFIAISHRADVAVSYFGLKIYADHFATVLARMPAATGGYLAYSTADADGEALNVEIEVCDEGTACSEGACAEVHESLRAVNAEYRKLAAALGDVRSMPRVRLHRRGALERRVAFEPVPRPAVYRQAGKKARTLI